MESISTKDKTTLAEKAKEVITTQVRKPVLARLKDRLREIRRDSQAKITKIPMGNTHMFETIEPKMFISSLEGRMEGGVGIISYQLYKKEGKNKAVKITEREVNGKMIEVDAAYIIDKMIVERIEYMKPIKKEEISYE